MAKFERKFGLSPPEVKYTKEEILKMDTEEDLRDACEELDIKALVKSLGSSGRENRSPSA